MTDIKKETNEFLIKSGLNFAWRIVEDNIRKAEEKSLEKNEGKRKKSFEKVEG